MISYCRRTCQTLTTIVLLALIAGCSTPTLIPTATLLPAITDRSPFTGIPCSAPCWHGLVVGKSSESQVRSTLPTLTYLNQESIEFVQITNVNGPDPDVAYPGVEITAGCLRPAQQCLTMEVADNVLTQIDILLNYQIPVDEIVADLGPPTYVGSQLLGAEILTCQVELVWYSKQLVLSSVPESWDRSKPKDPCVIVQNTHKIPSNLTILGVSYMLNPWIERVLKGAGSEFFNYSGITPVQ
jgi:hypothetical protein